jgi:hypothetical protein
MVDTRFSDFAPKSKFATEPLRFPLLPLGDDESLGLRQGGQHLLLDEGLQRVHLRFPVAQPFNGFLQIRVIGLVVGVVGLYLYIVDQKTRELTSTVSPGRTTIVKAGEVSDLTVSYKGEPIETDVSAVQVQIWNEGRENIRQNHMHEPMVISTVNGAAILEAKILRHTRPEKPKIVGLKVDDESQKDRGRIGVTWNILEYRDGGIVQLIIKGKPEVNVKAEAMVEDQQAIHEAIPLHPARKHVMMMSLVILPMITWLVVAMWLRARREGIQDRFIRRGMPVVAVAGFALLALILYRLLTEFSSPPPLAF